MEEIIFIAGPDDNNKSRIKKTGINTSISFKGILPIFTLIDSNKSIFDNSSKFFINFHQYLHHKKDLKDVVLFNLVSDADACKYSLAFITNLIKNNNFKKILNHPEKVISTSRRNLSQLLNGIEGIVVPEIKHVTIESIEELKSYLIEKGIELPVIIRAVGFNNSLHMELIESIEQLDHINKLFEVSSNFYLIRYYDTSGGSNFYKKYRVAVINGQVYPQHLLTSEHWNVSVSARKGIMLNNQELRFDENNFLETFESSFFMRYKHIFDEINERISLEIYGIDFSVMPNGQLVIFEANASMDLISMWLGPNHEYDYKKPYRYQVKRSIEKLLTGTL